MGPPSKPSHLAIIMDGNGRWAQTRGLPRQAGHRAGIDAVRRAVRAADALGLKRLTLFGFSSENWKRPRAEVDYLMDLLRLFIRREIADLHVNRVRVTIMGEREGLAPDILKLIENAEAKTRDNPGLRLCIAFNYGGQAEILGAVNACLSQGPPDEIDEATLTAHLYDPANGDPELVIRTSGERRLSNFLLWQAGGAELVFEDDFWPDFKQAHMEAALAEYAARKQAAMAAGA